MSTDIDRLHAVLEDPHPGARSGKTTAVCHLIAGAIEMGETRVHVMLSHLSDYQHFSDVLRQILQEHELQACLGECGGLVLTGHTCTVQFHCDGFPIRRSAFPMWDARRHARPGMIDCDEYVYLTP